MHFTNSLIWQRGFGDSLVAGTGLELTTKSVHHSHREQLLQNTAASPTLRGGDPVVGGITISVWKLVKMILRLSLS